MKAWRGKSLFAIGVIHNVVGFLIGYQILGEMLREGLFNTITEQHDRNAVFWFIFSGFALMLFGATVDWMERSVKDLPRFLGPSFLVLTVVGAFIMPESGFWLLFVPSIGMLVRGQRERGG